MVLFCVGVLTALAAAARSTYSPCGLSMLSSITPLGERARGHRYGVTATWFVLGASAGGATLGGLSAALAAAVGTFGHGRSWTDGAIGVAAVVAGAGALLDAGAFGAVLPLIRRQVDDRWLARYRPWVYGTGFGWQIGVGVATYVMTAAVGLVVAFGVLSGSPLAAFTLGVVFGLARGATVLLTANVAGPADLRYLHGRLDAIGAPIRRAVTGVQAGLAVGLAAVAFVGPGSGVEVVVAVGAGLVAGALGASRARWYRPAGRRSQAVHLDTASGSS